MKTLYEVCASIDNREGGGIGNAVYIYMVTSRPMRAHGTPPSQFSTGYIPHSTVQHNYGLLWHYAD